MLLVATTVIGLAGCKSSRKYDDDSLHAASTFEVSDALAIIPGKGTRRVDLAADIFDAAAAFDAEHGAFAHVSAEKRDEFKAELRKALEAKVDENGNPLYTFGSDEEWDRAFEDAFRFKDADGDGTHDYLDDTPDGDKNNNGEADWKDAGFDSRKDYLKGYDNKEQMEKQEAARALERQKRHEAAIWAAWYEKNFGGEGIRVDPNPIIGPPITPPIFPW